MFVTISPPRVPRITSGPSVPAWPRRRAGARRSAGAAIHKAGGCAAASGPVHGHGQVLRSGRRVASRQAVGLGEIAKAPGHVCRRAGTQAPELTGRLDGVGSGIAVTGFVARSSEERGGVGRQEVVEGRDPAPRRRPFQRRDHGHAQSDAAARLGDDHGPEQAVLAGAFETGETPPRPTASSNWKNGGPARADRLPEVRPP